MSTTPNPTEAEETQEQLDRVLSAAADCTWSQTSPHTRADALAAVADALDARSDALVREALRETGLPEARLTGELTRTTVQLRMFAEELRDGSYLRIALDRADPDFALGARPDLRRWLIPVGPVLVYAASNFPFAFSVAGGDTASALAAGCPVVLKAHPGHPETSRLTAETVLTALRESGAPEGTFALITGRQAGVSALRDPRVAAGAFTGSVTGGRALFDIASSRQDPIPFFGELGSINPAVVTAGAERESAEQIAAGFVGSFTLGAGQFCTKPGILLLPSGSELPKRIAELARDVPAARMLTSAIAERYRETTAQLCELDGVEVLVRGTEEPDPSGVARVSPTVLHAGGASELLTETALLEENFGPFAVIAEYSSDEELRSVLAAVPGSLTVTVHAADDPDSDERRSLRDLVALAAAGSGRIVFGQWPTGVAVTPAQQHGGPYPATTAASTTSVGTAAIDRFLRPVSYQNAPEFLLPEALRESNPLGLPRSTHQPGASQRWTAPQQ
ncbi:aldehyde dehydrogenase (NADP(+)) [Saccharopolyspora sp. TS4A08]|uniref:Aldehyde dehydrogenase (NADP(+)) n=1 Tax=Saccharopolyspora ipomoeae TaxID=3042027 RepID=A0ABT6PJ23_9PSEU|nr:aldehyde dehydrogenase (NADP(+)) [Saccharopolyspora sp. TS4A08]MDI2027653.1 aldehyde dehydrogenase (NADP(+)) [Saccharopolyspora sp. TS4A08]